MRRALVITVTFGALAVGCGGDDGVSAADAEQCFRAAGGDVRQLAAADFPQQVELEDAFSVSFAFVDNEYEHNAFTVVFAPSEEAVATGIRALKNLARQPTGQPRGEQQLERSYSRYDDAFVFWATPPAAATRALADRCVGGVEA